MDRPAENAPEVVDAPDADIALTGAEEWLSTLNDSTTTVQESSGTRSD